MLSIKEIIRVRSKDKVENSEDKYKRKKDREKKEKQKQIKKGKRGYVTIFFKQL